MPSKQVITCHIAPSGRCRRWLECGSCAHLRAAGEKPLGIVEVEAPAQSLPGDVPLALALRLVRPEDELEVYVTFWRCRNAGRPPNLEDAVRIAKMIRESNSRR